MRECHPTREQLRGIISLVDEDDSIDEFHDSLLQFKCLPSEIQQQEDDDDSLPKKFTPLVYACKMEHSCALQYMLHTLQQQTNNKDKYHDVFELWGRPTDIPDTISGNTIFHQIADNGLTSILDILIQIFKFELQEEEEDYYYKSMCLRNKHGDTPLMIACVSGNLELLQHWIHSCTKQQHHIQRVMDLSNDAQDTILTLSFGHGSHTILQYLLDKHNHFQIQITYDDYRKCQLILQRTKAFLQLPNNHVTNRPFMEQRLQHMETYIVKLHQLYLEKCNQTMNELLLQEDNEKQQQQNKTTNQTNKKKKKKKRKKKKITQDQEETTTNQINTIDNDHENDDKILWNPSNEVTQESIPVHDPSIIHTNSNGIQNDSNQVDNQMDNLKQTLHATNLMENQREIDHGPTESNNNNKDTNRQDKELIPPSLNSSNSEAVMEALCLDSSMLLLTPHEMALYLSPSQLEAVEKVLLNQLNSVKVATSIQSRLRSTNFHNSDNEGGS